MDPSGSGRDGRGSRGGGRAGRRGNGTGGRGRGGRGSGGWQHRYENWDSGNQQHCRRQQTPNASGKTDQFERFVLAGLQKCPPHKLEKLIQDSESLWVDCWRKVAELPTPQLHIVLSALARLPFSSSIAPPNIRDVGRGVSSLVGELTCGAPDQWEGVDLSEDKLAAVELVEKLFEVRAQQLSYVSPYESSRCGGRLWLFCSA